MKRTVILIAALVCAIPVAAQNSNANPRAVDASMAHFSANARAYGLTNPSAELKVRQSKDVNGMSHVRFDQYFNGVPVFEGEAIAHVKNGRVEITNALRGNIKVDTTPSISAEAAVSKALAAIGPKGPFNQPTARLEIVAKGADTATDRLVWHVSAFIDNGIETGNWEYFIDAKSGETVLSFDNLQTATGNSMYLGGVTLDAGTQLVDSHGNKTTNMNTGTSGSGTVFSNASSTYGNGKISMPSDGASYDPSTAAADVHYGSGVTWDYYLNVLGRLGIDGNGTPAISRVHYSSAYDNAFWQDACYCMTYGDGSSFFPLVSLDVAAHEMSHGVMSREANLTYRGESGGLNEANSDIFGTLVEWAANAPSDTPDYLIGEKLSKANYDASRNWTNPASPRALRYQTKPSLDGRSPNCWSKQLKSLDVHYSSGPMNHAFYLATNGNGTGSNVSACNGTSVPSIARDTFAKIWYHAIANNMTASTTYAGARVAALNSAVQLGYSTTSPEYKAIAAAFSAINVN
jgi:zinc metalloprotease ZmpA